MPRQPSRAPFDDADPTCVTLVPVEASAAEVNEPVGPAGVLIFRGSTFALKDFQLSIDDEGNVASSMRPQIAWELWPLWLRVAIDHEAAAVTVRRQLAASGDASQDGLRAQLIEDETRAGLVAIAATAFTLEAMALSAATRAQLPAGIGKSASAARRIAEVLKQCFVIPPTRFMVWRRSLVAIFEARNAAVHPDAGLRDPMPHPGLHAGVPRPAHVFRLENTAAAVTTAISTAALVSGAPRPRLGKEFGDGVAGWANFTDDLRRHRTSLGGGSREPPSDERASAHRV